MDNQGRALLDQVYVTFTERTAELFDAVSEPGGLPQEARSVERWTDLGDWLGLAERLGAEKILFVRGDPVAVFTDARGTPDEAALGELYRRAWCMSEPRCLFVALPDEIRVYDLSLPPQRGSPPSSPWRVLSSVSDVLTLTQDIDKYGPDLQGLMDIGKAVPARADRRLIEDLRHVRTQLEATGLSMAEAHALIGRSILIRYLEDRGVLPRAYFERVAGDQLLWLEVLDDEGPTPIFGAPGKQRLYDRVLCNADFTHALFKTLATDFNGDLFALGEARKKRFGEAALKLMRKFLLGEAQAGQPPLFFWAYDFEVVPLALISSIYEQFYHDAVSKRDADKFADAGANAEGLLSNEGMGAEPEDARPVKGKRKPGDGTHYTPANLVHDALRRTLTPDRLAGRPTILDPACGSGIFLVEAFRRIVRYEASDCGRKLSPEELREILRSRIFGIEINAEAARVAAFSLYLALLDQQEPPDIASGGPLPYLLHSGERDQRHFGILLVSDAFALTPCEQDFLSQRVAAKKAYKGRADDVRLLGQAGSLDLPLAGFDVVVGNPPWQEMASQKEKPIPRLWAAAFRLPEGEGSLSQLFIHRALTMLRDGGALGMLISMKVFWNDRETSREFRRYLLTHTTLRQLVNMAHVRRVFFAKAVAPFAFLLAEKRPPASDDRIIFWNARRVGSVERLRSIGAVPFDRRVAAQRDMAEADYLWKLYWWGGHHDVALVARLTLERSFADVVGGVDPQPAYGWQRGSAKPSGNLARFRELDNKKVEPFGPLRDSWFLPPPKGIKRDPDQRIYEGQRLVITRGMTEPVGAIARLETEGFSFRHGFYCVPVGHLSQLEASLMLGMLWSSLGRYLLFMTAGNWGGWHDQVTSRDILRMPVRLKPSWGMARADHDDAAGRVMQAVDRLRRDPVEAPQDRPMLDLLEEPRPKTSRWLAQLDTAVFDLFELSQAERDLVEDFWAENHDLYWKGAASSAINRLPLPTFASGRRADLPDQPSRSSLQRYLSALLDAWVGYLPEKADFHWQVATSPGQDLIAVIVTLETPGDTGRALRPANWQAILARCAAAIAQPVSQAFLTKRVVRAVTGDSFIIVRENARRLWTASTAREDADAVFVQLASRPKS
jgi:hypothetical protein